TSRASPGDLAASSACPADELFRPGARRRGGERLARRDRAMIVEAARRRCEATASPVSLHELEDRLGRGCLAVLVEVGVLREVEIAVGARGAQCRRGVDKGNALCVTEGS